MFEQSPDLCFWVSATMSKTFRTRDCVKLSADRNRDTHVDNLPEEKYDYYIE